MEAGYGNGLTLKMLLTSGTVVWDEVFQALASDLKKVGVTLSIQPVPQQVMADYRLHGGVPADAFAVAYSSPTLDGLEILREHSCLWPNPWFCDEVTAQLIEKAELESDLGKREQLVMDLQARVHESAQGMFLYESVGLSGYSRRIDVYLTDFGFPRYELMTVRDSEH
jgi:ABC-type transport system substrate-binding protein